MDANPLAHDKQPETNVMAPVRQMRILVSGYRSHPHVGGQGVYIHELTRALKQLGHEVSVASGPPYPELVDGIKLIKLPALDLFTHDNAFLALRAKHLSSWSDMSEWLSHNSGAFGELYAFARRLDKYLAKNAHLYDVIHDNQTLASPLLRIQKRLPVITTLHHPIAIDRDYALAASDKWWEKALTRRWYNFVKMQARTSRKLPHLFAVSAAARDSHAQHYGVNPDTIRVSFNGIDHDIFHPEAEIKRETGLIVTTASADAAIKGLDILINAFAKVAVSRPSARLHIVGTLREGPAKQAIKRLGLSNRVTSSSNLTRTAIADLYRQAHIVACPARFEGFGFPAAEAMACGAAVVASNGGALPEVVGKTGLVSDVGDTESMANHLAHLLDSPEEAARLGQAASKRARQEFNWSAHALAATRLYAETLAEQGIPA